MNHISEGPSEAELQRLAQSVYEGVSNDEGYLIETKTTLDFRRADHKAKIARTLLAFANRTEQDPLPSVLLLGIDRGRVERDRAEVDPSVAGNALRPFLSPLGLRWHFTNLTADGCVVHAITVDAPQWGDPIFTLGKECTVSTGNGSTKTYVRGTGFVRDGSNTVQATPEHIALLTERAIASDRYFRDVAVRVESGSVHTIAPERYIPELVEEERGRLLAFVDEPFVPTGPLAKLGKPEWRTPAQYTVEVQEYISALEQHLAEWAGWRPSQFAPIELAVCNLGEDNRSDVVLEARFPDDCLVIIDPERALTRQRPALPHAPSPFGWAGLNARPYDAQAALSRVLLTNDPYRAVPERVLFAGAWQCLPRLVNPGNTVRFPSCNLRPRHAVTQEAIIVAAPSDATRVDVEWSLTATNCSGTPTGSLALPLTPGVTIGDLRSVIHERT